MASYRYDRCRDNNGLNLGPIEYPQDFGRRKLMKNIKNILSLVILLFLLSPEQLVFAKTSRPQSHPKKMMQRQTVQTKKNFQKQNISQQRRSQITARKAARIRARKRAAALRRASKLKRCSIALPQVNGQLPFGPGENLSYIIKLGDIYVGRASLHFDKASRYGNEWVYAIHGQAKTNSFFNKFSQVESRMTSLLSPDNVHPQAMYSRSISQRGERIEEARFIPEERRVEASLTWRERNWIGSSKGGQMIQDVLSVMYFARSRTFYENQDFCTELYYGKRLWVIRGTLQGQRSISTKAGSFNAWKLKAVAERDGRPHFKRRFSMWISADDDRLPLRLVAPSSYGEITVDIDGFTRGRRLKKEQSTLAKDSHERS